MLEEVLVLNVSPSGGYGPVRKKFCGFEWEAEASVNEALLHIVLWCNRNVEGSLWRCTARVTVRTTGDDGSHDAVRKVSFNKINRSLFIETTKGALCPDGIEIRLELFDILGYRDPAMYQIDFSKPSPNSNVCFSFDRSDVRLYANKEYLGVHSEKLRHLFSQPDAASTTTHSFSSRMSDFGDDFDVLSVQSDASTTLEESLEESELECDGIRFLVQEAGPLESMASAGNAELEHLLLKDVEPDDFQLLLKTIYPPFVEITKENVRKILAMAYRFGVEHIVCRCEQYFLKEDGTQSLDSFERLELSTSYKMAALQADCLKSLTTANDVRKLLDDPRLVSAPKEMRSILLETLLHRFKADSDVPTEGTASQSLRKSPKRSITAATASAQNLVCRLFETVGLTEKKCATSSGSSSNNKLPNIKQPQPVQKKTSSAVSSEVASLKNELKRQDGIRKNLEFSLKCYQEFIRDTERRAATAAVEASTEVKVEAVGSSVPPQDSKVESLSSSHEEKPPVPPPRRVKLANPGDHDFLKNIVFDTFNACELSKDRTIVVGCTRAFSAHDLFADLVLPPYTSMKNVIYSFVTHLFTKLYGDKIVQIVRLHFARKVDAFPQSLAERVAGAIIAGYELKKQLGNDDLLVHELRVYFVKQLTKNFDEFVGNIKTGYFANSFS